MGEPTPPSEPPKRPAEQMQDQLRKVYLSLPKQQAISPDKPWNMSKKRQRRYFKEKLNRERKREQSIVRLRQMATVGVLLREARVTQTLKENIINAFDTRFEIGVTTTGDPVLHLLGITDVNPHPQGIFSADPKVRMSIERRLCIRMLDSVKKLEADAEADQNPSLLHQAAKDRGMIYAYAHEFEQLYGQSIVPPAPRRGDPRL